MKSAYGLTTPQENAELTHVEPGTPMGELLRRFWQPVALSAELTDLPKKIKIMCEELVVFRTKDGALGCLTPHCSHRGTSLEWGRIEKDGLRCCYHGWLYAPDGRVTEMSCETKEFCARANIQHPAYPIMEYGGLVFIYMGPPEKKPLFPLYDIIDTRERNDVELRGMQLWDGYGIGYVKDCNWLQHHENVVDPWHLLVLHQQISGDQFDGALMQGRSKIDFESTDLGVRYRVIKDLPNGNRLVRYAEVVMPNIILVPNIHEQGTVPKNKDRCTEITWTVPVDNEHLTAFSIVAWPLVDGKPVDDWMPGTDVRIKVRPAGQGERTYEERQRNPDDREAQEGQRPIAIHALERLAPSDRGVVMLRRQLKEQIQIVKDGNDPMNIVRDEGANTRIRTNAWNTVLSPEQATKHQGEEA
uniref:MnbA n=1 Tax=Comamonas sp. JS46 TaxID=298265 RepID=Q5GDA4_9BURK|nr:MnbA [Comamonas sp. JS46]